MSIASERKLKSLSFGTEDPIIPGHGSKELIDLRGDVEDGFVALEGKVRMPRITKISGSVGAAGGSSSLTITGVEFLANRAKASLAIGSGASLVTISACRPGEDGNDISVAFVDPAANSQALAVSVTGSLVEVSLATGVAGAITSTAAEVTAAINADADAKVLVKAVGAGAGVVAAAAEANLAGGTGRGLFVYVAGTAVAVDDAVSDTVISVLDGEAAGLTEANVAVIEVKSHTLITSGVPVIVAA